MRKRAAAILLALCMALTLLPTAAFATEEGGAAAPVEQPTQQEEKQEGQQEQPAEPRNSRKNNRKQKPAEQPEQQQESAAQGGPAVQSNETASPCWQMSTSTASAEAASRRGIIPAIPTWPISRGTARTAFRIRTIPPTSI